MNHVKQSGCLLGVYDKFLWNKYAHGSQPHEQTSAIFHSAADAVAAAAAAGGLICR